MPAFSFTAPLITPEQAQAEREALSPEERERIRRDVYGSDEQILETDETRQNALALFAEALANIPADQKRDYLEAFEVMPDLVEREALPLDFLRCEEYNAWAAVRRYVGYWSTRKSIFGRDRWLLPMTLDGAMESEVEYLEKALFLILPNDNHGRPVVLLDRIQLFKAGTPRDSVCRVLFYIIHVLLRRHDQASRTGIVSFVNYQGYDLYKHHDRMTTKKVRKMYEDLPVKVKAVHLFTGSGRSVMEVVLPIMMHIFGRDIRLRCKLHAGSSSEVFARAADHGLRREHIQCVYEGGIFRRMELARAWVREQREIERNERTSSTADGE